MEKTNIIVADKKIRELDYAAWTRVNKGKNTFYVTIHATDVDVEGIEKGDYVLVKLVRLKKYDPFTRRPE